MKEHFKDIFSTNGFYFFLEENREFFKLFLRHFCSIFTDTAQKQKIKIKKTEKFKLLINKLYISLFIHPLIEEKDEIIAKRLQILNKLQDLNVDILYVLDKTFLIMLNYYIKYLVNKENSISKAKTMAELLEFYLRYIDFHIQPTNIEEENLSIPDKFIEYYKTKKELNLFNLYKGIPITYKAIIEKVDTKRNTVTIQTHHFQTIAAQLQREIFIIDEEENLTFRAKVQRSILNERKLELYDIELVKKELKKRSFVRVQPKEKIVIKIKTPEIQEVELIDLSLRGMAVLSDKELNIHVADYVNIEFSIPIEEQIINFSTTAEVKSISYLNKQYRYHFYFKLKPYYESYLAKYITSREKEIIQELNQYLNSKLIDLKSDE